MIKENSHSSLTSPSARLNKKPSICIHFSYMQLLTIEWNRSEFPINARRCNDAPYSNNISTKATALARMAISRHRSNSLFYEYQFFDQLKPSQERK